MRHKRIRKCLDSFLIMLLMIMFCSKEVLAGCNSCGEYVRPEIPRHADDDIPHHSHGSYHSHLSGKPHPLHKPAKKHSKRRSVETFLGYSSACEYYTTSYPATCASNIGADIRRDFCTYFQPCNLLMFSTFLGLAALSANTGFDRSVAEHWQLEIHNSGSEGFFKPFKDVGALSYWYIPLYLGAAAIGAWRSETFLGNVLYNWGYRGFRTGILSIVQQIPLAYLTGSGRPNQHQPSKWQPFKYKTGVSGHTVFGAIPFLTAAYMTDPPLLRFGLFVLSTLPGLSRINDNRHYLSQVLLGWGIAFLSARAVYESDLERACACQIMLEPRYDGAMFRATYQF